jgi:HNH endonuclease
MKRISPHRLKCLLEYHSDTGFLTWKRRDRKMFKTDRDWKLWNAQYAEKAALTAISGGYCHGIILQKTYSAHRVIWAIFYGKWPSDEIDHVNHDRSDNKIKNLRDVVSLENMKNKKLYISNKIGTPGVVWQKNDAKWAARIGGKNRIHLGLFSSKEEAIAARHSAEIQYGYHKNHGLYK